MLSPVVAVFERVSKAALVASVAALAVLHVALHPDLTPALQAAGIVALIAGLLTGGLASGAGVAVWVVAAPLAPALLRALTGREGPVLDIVWMAGLAGALLRGSSWWRWNLPPLWRLLLGAWALTLTLAWPIVVARELGFDRHTFTDPGAVNSWAQLTAGQVVAWVFYIAQTQLLALLWFDWLAGEFSGEAAGRARVAFHALWIGATIASVVALYQGAMALSFLSTAFWAREHRATGTLLDANGYGMIAALAAPVAVLWLWARPWPRTAVVVFAVNAVGLWMSGSRTAFVCGAAGVLGLAAVFAFRRQQLALSRRVTALAASAILAVTVLVMFGSAIGPLRRIAEVPLSRAGLADLWSRGGYGTIAVRMVRDTPWTGVGPGMYHVIAPDYWRVMRDMTLAFDNAQNWWRHQVSELGILGAAPLLAWSALLAGGLFFGSPKAGRSDAYLPRALLAGLGLASLLGMPTQSPVVLIWFFGLVAWWAAMSEGVLAEGRLTARWRPAAALLLLVLILLHATGTVVLARSWLSVPERAKRAHRDYVVGAYEAEPLAGATSFRWTGGDARFVWAPRTRWMLLRVWVRHPDAASAPVRVTVDTPCGTLLDADLRSADPVSVSVQLPEGADTLEAVVRTSRTWQPAPAGVGDSRRLGAAVVAATLQSRGDAAAQDRFVELARCGKREAMQKRSDRER